MRNICDIYHNKTDKNWIEKKIVKHLFQNVHMYICYGAVIKCIILKHYKIYKIG